MTNWQHCFLHCDAHGWADQEPLLGWGCLVQPPRRMYLGLSGTGKGAADAAMGVGHDGCWLLSALVSLGLKAHAVHPEAKTVIILVNKRFPAHDELGTCRTSLVSPEQREHLEEPWEVNKKGRALKDA